MDAEVKVLVDDFEQKLMQLCAEKMCVAQDNDKFLDGGSAPESADVGLAFYKMVEAFVEAKKDGLGVGDIPELAMAAVQNLYKAIQGAEKIPGEFKADFGVAMLSIIKPILDAVKLLMKK
jgi:hypothetical protein